MKTYNITFAHPVEGKAYLTDPKQGIRRIYSLKTDDECVVKIPLKGVKKGNWHITFEWEYEEHYYSCNAKLIM